MRERKTTVTRRLRPAICVAALLACLPAASMAQESDEASPLDPLKACQAESDPAARLACYDTAVAEMVAASDQGDLRIVDAEAVRKTRRSLFGFSIPDLGIFGGDEGDDEEEDEFDTLETTVTSVRYLTPRSFVFRIAEGNALWQVSDAPARLLTVESGDPVVIEEGALSSYFIRFDGQNGVKGKRIE